MGCRGASHQPEAAVVVPAARPVQGRLARQSMRPPSGSIRGMIQYREGAMIVARSEPKASSS
jgi:hypothetical protein